MVVFSGGQDSTTCLFWAKKHFSKVYALSFVYGQKHVKEVELARSIAAGAGVEFEAMDVSFIGHLRIPLLQWTRISRPIVSRILLFRGVTCFS